jgi:hypothetical protein
MPGIVVGLRPMPGHSASSVLSGCPCQIVQPQSASRVRRRKVDSYEKCVNSAAHSSQVANT